EEESYSLQHLEVDEEYQQLVEKFKERTKMMMKEMGEYVAANDMKNLAGVSHTLKGLGGSFGFPEVTELSGSLEQAARDSDQAMSEDVFSRLNAFVQANVI
ncbi:MAG: Hpt domain-containing protein, partial [Gammaproteobacteria bacterium]|nr:Hpt domain-containing protein [Gammaproteobacteria bacterium]